MFEVVKHPNGTFPNPQLCHSVAEGRGLIWRWLHRDQELRFTVHDSPDYYQLKMSIFTDDKKTDLIGESWVDLKGIIVPGGGQSDMWQSLTCRGKYAGEIRLEITYYDTRPRPERAPAKQKQQAGVEQEDTPPKQRTPMKRRPLPSDPVTGEAPSPPIAIASQPELHQHKPPRSHGKSASYSGFIPNQSPLQSVEYNTPPPQVARQTLDHYSPSPHSGHRQGHRTRESQGTPERYADDRVYPQRGTASPYDQSQLDDVMRQSPFDDGTPPPPPAHRSRHNSPGQEVLHREGSPQKSPMPMRNDVLRNEAHRQSTSAYPGQPSFVPFDSPTARPNLVTSRHSSPYGETYESYNPAYDDHSRSMQPTVEDVPESPTVAYGRRGSSRMAYQEEMGYDNAPSPMHQNMSRSPGVSPGQLDNHGYPTSVSPLSFQDYSNNSSQVSHNSQTSQSYRADRRGDFEPNLARNPPSYGTPPLPPSLAPGVDPALSQEISDRIHEERRYDPRFGGQPVTTPTRGRHRSEGPASYGASPTHTPHSYDGRSGVTYSSRPTPDAARHRRTPSPNPNPQHTIRRKSVSPAPPPSENRRASDIPFGPDSYEAFNPSMGSPAANNGSRSNMVPPVDPNAKIIAHDGREIDPSDHLPMESWAPEPEPKPGQAKISPEPRARPSLAGAQPMPASGRRPLRVATRPEPAMPPAPAYQQPEEPRTPPTTGRNRLQKKGPRSTGHSPSVSSPLAPISPDNYQERQGPYTPTRGPHRGGSWDYPNENHAPYHGYGPPIPAKVPLTTMSGANGGVDVSLMEEMQRIDLGAGRSRRRGGY